MSLSVTIPLCCLALAIEALVGYPAWLYRVLGHPVTWMGRFLAVLERRLNRERWSVAQRRSAGVLALVLLLGSAVVVTLPAQILLPRWLAGFVVLALLAATLPAQRSLFTHVRDVADALEHGGVTAGRQAVSMIVGRNTAVLDEAGVARAAIESLAENFSDGIVAPAFWLAVAGLPGGTLYKAANTADSMIGHRTPRYEAFGWAAARFDDAINLPASRPRGSLDRHGGAPGRRIRPRGLCRGQARRPPSPFAQCGVARSGFRRRAGSEACRSAGLRHRDGGRRFHGQRPTERRCRRYPPGAGSVPAGLRHAMGARGRGLAVWVR